MPKFPDPINPWDRQRYESMFWYARFEKFRLAGPTRSVLGAYNQELVAAGREPKKCQPSSWKHACNYWKWRERAEAWDNAQLEQAREIWADRRDQWRQEEWDLATALREKAFDMLGFPVAKVTREKDGQVTIVEPSEWRLVDAAKLIDTASKIARLSTGMVNERTESVEWDPSKFTTEELMQIAETGDVQTVIDKHQQGTGNLSLPDGKR